MSSCIDVSSEQLCYIPCNFCNIVLAVSVPCSNLLDIVTVRCGHCTNLWSVNMAAAFHSFSSSSSSSSTYQDLHHPSSSTYQDLHHPNQVLNYNNPSYRMNNGLGSSSRYYNNKTTTRTAPPPTNSPNPTPERVVNRPPEKRQRVPSAYNQFIKEEIQRIKANNPDISHREAFSTAAKNWAHFPHIHFGLMLETNNQLPKLNEGHDKHMLARTAMLNN